MVNMKRKYSTGVVFALMILAITSCGKGNADKKSGAKSGNDVKVEGFIVQPSVLNQTVALSGTVKAFEETVLMPEVSGRVVAVNLPEGKFVKQGTLLVKIFDGDLQAQLRKAQIQLQLAEQTQKRQSELRKVEGVSQADFDQATLQVNSLKADIELIKVQIRKTEIQAPFDGIIGLRNVSVGAQISPSIAVAIIRKSDKLKIDFGVPEKYSRYIKPGLKVKFTLQGSETAYDATVFASERGIEASTRNLKIRAIIDSRSDELIPGAYANVVLRLSEDHNAMLIPSQAIIPQENKKNVIIASNGKAKFVAIKTGTRTSSRVEVLEGLKNGDTLVTTGLLFLKPDAILKFTKVKRDSL